MPRLTATGVFQPFYERTLLPNQTSSNIAWIGSLQAFLLIGLVLGMLMTGLCSQYWQLMLSQGVVVGLGSRCLFLPSIAVLPQYFEKRRALATGIGSSGSAIGETCYPSLSPYAYTFPGGICFPILFDRLQPRIGFRYASWLIALIMLVTLIIPVATLRMRSRPDKVRRIFDERALNKSRSCYGLPIFS